MCYKLQKVKIWVQKNKNNVIVVFVLSSRWTIDQRNPEFQPFKRFVFYTYITNLSKGTNF
ncbi:hypothetical protein LJCM5344_13710 [Lactobacillus paragasseri]|nr:hypothetical protein LJCM5344_13710 [Lactobacillus paragasseri]